MHREPKFRWMRNRSSHYLQEKEGCLGRLISSIKCLNPLLPPFPTTSATLQSVSPKVQLPKTWDPKRILTRSTFDRQFCPVRWSGRSLQHSDCKLPAEQAILKMKSRWATPSASRSDDRPAPGPHQVTWDGTLWSCDQCFHKPIRTYPSKWLLFSRGSP